MPYNYRIHAAVLLFAALILSLLVSLSLPFLPAFNIVGIHIANNGLLAGIETTSEIRLGIWTFCGYADDGSHLCEPKKLGYEVILIDLLRLENFVVIKSSWTRGLVVHTIATGFIFIAFFTSFSQRLTHNLVACLVASFTALITLVAFAFDIALFAHVRNVVKNIDAGASTATATGFWLTFATLALVILASVVLYLGRRREHKSRESTNYPMQTSKSGKLWVKLNEAS